MLEKNLQQKIMQICKKADILCVKLDSTSTRGWPDLLLLTPAGSNILLELKTATGKASKLQKHLHDKIKRNNGNVYIVRTIEEFNAIIEKHTDSGTAKSNYGNI